MFLKTYSLDAQLNKYPSCPSCQAVLKNDDFRSQNLWCGTFHIFPCPSCGVRIQLYAKEVKIEAQTVE